ncbi:DUF4253 domain-containing protein [Paenibacillus sp. GCM10027626]|uniref:DUF4253 domain-containing protein n=1 Tax=Paenibacillus sp. GCM10027626 TaxID=3273411 RepID=UPI003631F352
MTEIIAQLSQFLEEQDIEIVPVENVESAFRAGEHNVLILHGYNILEMMEEMEEEHDSLSSFVENTLQEAEELPVDEAWKRIVQSALTYASLTPEQKDVEGKDFDDLFGAYALLWENEKLLDLTIIDSAIEPVTLEPSWIQQRLEEEEEQLLVLHLPQQSGYEAALWIPMGGFNECPLPLCQAVIFKHWQEKYNTTPLAVSQDSWVIRTGQRPQTEEEAIQLAKEHFMLCSYVLESFDTLGQYADYLMKHDVWHFWWD